MPKDYDCVRRREGVKSQGANCITTQQTKSNVSPLRIALSQPHAPPLPSAVNGCRRTRQLLSVSWNFNSFHFFPGFQILMVCLWCYLLMQVVLDRGDEERKEEEERENGKEEEELMDLEKGGRNIGEGEAVQIHPPNEFHMSRMQRLSATNPLRLVMNNATRVASPSPARTTPLHPPPPPRPSPSPSPSPLQHQPRSTPTPQVNLSPIKCVCVIYIHDCMRC